MGTVRLLNKLICVISLFVLLNSIATGATNNLWKASYDLEKTKNYDKAAQVLCPLLKQCQNRELLMLRLGWLNYLGDHYNQSIQYYSYALNMNPYSIDARLGLTLPLLAQNRWKEAALYANQVICMSKWNYYAHLRLMSSEAGQLEWEVLEEHAAQVALHYPSEAAVLNYLALAQAMQSKIGCSICTYYQVLLRSPDNAEAHKYLAKLSCGMC